MLSFKPKLFEGNMFEAYKNHPSKPYSLTLSKFISIERQKGFTLVEIILAILIFSIVGIISFSFISRIILTNQIMAEQMVLTDEANIALELLSRELRDANQDSGPPQCGNPLSFCTVGNSYDTIRFDKNLENPIDSTRIDQNGFNIEYSYNSGNNTLDRTSSGITSVVARNVQSFTVSQAFTNVYSMQMSMTGSDGKSFTAETSVRIINDNGVSASSLAMVVGNSGSLSATLDTPLRDHLQNLGHTVTIFDDSLNNFPTDWDPTTFDAVVISESVNSGDTANLKTQAVPIFTVEGSNWDELDLGTAGSSGGGGDTDVNILDNTHFITLPYSLGTLTVTSVTTDLGEMRGWTSGSSDVDALAVYSSTTTQAKLLYVESGDTLTDGTTAAARRVFLGARFFDNLNEDGRVLFNRSLVWVLS